MKKKIALLVRSLLSLVHIVFVKLINPIGFHCAPAQDFSLTTKLSVSDGGSMFLKKHIHSKRNVFFVSDSGVIEIGEGCFFNNGCMIVSKERVTIGKNTSFGPNVLVYDHDHDISGDKAIHDSGFVTSPVVIGDDVWVGAGSIILRGSVIGSGSVIGAGSVIKGIYPPRSVVIQKRGEEKIRERTGA